MKPYDDENCECYILEEKITNKSSDWNCGMACKLWRRLSQTLEDNNIEYEPHSDNCYACCCPTCGRIVCGWCV